VIGQPLPKWVDRPVKDVVASVDTAWRHASDETGCPVLKMEKERAQITSALDPNETIAAISPAQAKAAGPRKRAAEDGGARSDECAVLAPVTGLGAVRVSFPPHVWVVVTNKRVLLFRNGRRSGRPLVGDLVFEAPTSDLSVCLKGRLLRQVVVSDASSGAPVVRLNVGAARAAATAVVEAAGAGVAVDDDRPVPSDPSVIDLRPGERLPDGSVLTASDWLRAVRDADGRYR
jgi:hypothetical protein